MSASRRQTVGGGTTASLSVRAGIALAVLVGCVTIPATGVAAQTSGVASASAEGLEPGDLVRLKIWREPDLSGDFRVDEKGMTVFPKLGPMNVQHVSLDSLHTELVTRYTRYLQSPSVEVTFLRRVNIVGEVKSPGLYHVDPTMTLPDVLALAGGITPDGDVRKVELIRRGSRSVSHLTQGVSLADSTLRSGDQLRVAQRGWIARNAAATLAAGITGAALVLAAILRP